MTCVLLCSGLDVKPSMPTRLPLPHEIHADFPSLFHHHPPHTQTQTHDTSGPHLFTRALKILRVPDFNPPADGYKRFVFPDGKGVYDGHWRGCKRHGQGSFSFANGDMYDGEPGRCHSGNRESMVVSWWLLDL